MSVMTRDWWREYRRQRYESGTCRDCSRPRVEDRLLCESCLQRQRAANAMRGRTYRIWTNMLTRCRNPKATHYDRYGGRGIGVCERWLTFANFVADMGEPDPGMTIERLNNDGHYEPGNCAWRTPQHQANNRSSNHILTFQGRAMSLADWGRECGLAQRTLYQRLKRGWSVERALTKDVAK